MGSLLSLCALFPTSSSNLTLGGQSLLMVIAGTWLLIVFSQKFYPGAPLAIVARTHISCILAYEANA